MQFQDVLHLRRSVRRYTNEPISRGIVEKLIDDAAFAPSARNQQPWRFWVILGKQQIQAVSDRIHEWLRNEAKNHDALRTLREYLQDPSFEVLYGASALILIGSESENAQDHEDCCLAAMSLLLSARNACLGTCWIGLSRPWFNLVSTKSELGIPEKATIVAPIIVGHPTNWPESPGRISPKIQWLSQEDKDAHKS